jgi:hypothetical protein
MHERAELGKQYVSEIFREDAYSEVQRQARILKKEKSVDSGLTY